MFLIGALLLLAGQAALLAGTVAGKTVAYQHLAPWGTPARAWPVWAWGVFGAQLVFIVATRARWTPFARQLAAALGPVRLALLCGAVLAVSAALSRSPIATAAEATVAALLHALQLATVAATIGLVRTDALTRIAQRMHTALEQAWTVRVAAVLSVLVSAALAWFVYERHPHVPDEVAYLFQARYLAAGHLWLPVPAVPEAFDVPFMLVQDGRWYSAMPSGWAFLLALGERAGAGWLVNPLLGGLNVWLMARVARAIGLSTATATVAAILLAVSPWHLFLAMSLMSHTLSLTLTLIATWSIVHVRHTRRLLAIIPAGATIGFVGINRPLEGVAVALVLGCVMLAPMGSSNTGTGTGTGTGTPTQPWWRTLHWRTLHWRDTVLLATCTALVGGLVLPWNKFFTGHASTFPVMRYMDLTYGPGRNALGFGPQRGLGWQGLDPLPGHGAPDVVINALLNLSQIDVELFGWAAGSLLLPLVALMRRHRSPRDLTLAATIVALVLVHSVYWFSGGPDFGARYWFLAIAPLVLLSASALTANDMQPASVASHALPALPALLPGAALCICVALAVFVPWRARDKYVGYRGMTAAARPLLTDARYDAAILLVRGRSHPDVASSVIYNAIDPNDREALFAWDRDADVRRRLATAYPQRAFFIVDGPSLTGDGYRVVAGPYAADALLQGRVADTARLSSDSLTNVPSR